MVPPPQSPSASPSPHGGAAGEVDAATRGQSHPLYSADRTTVDRLLAAEAPLDGDLVDAARLLTRYDGFPGAFDLQDDLGRALRHWGLTRETLQARTRAIWQGGYRVGAADSRAAEAVGSGFDAAADGEG
ncbi:MAG: DUF3288 family protein [Cyanobacteriota bacterium]|nr:DUF3288 family protein [Cyanobacteriota bacterium]